MPPDAGNLRVPFFAGNCDDKSLFLLIWQVKKPSKFLELFTIAGIQHLSLSQMIEL